MSLFKLLWNKLQGWFGHQCVESLHYDDYLHRCSGDKGHSGAHVNRISGVCWMTFERENPFAPFFNTVWR